MLRLENVSCHYGEGVVAVKDLNLTLEQGEFFCLLGPSGCGKSTLLSAIGGYMTVQSGSISIGGKDVTMAMPDRRDTAIVFQSYALFPHLTARDNVAFGLRVRGIGKTERLRQADEMLDWVRLSKEERTRRPRELSGGQQQRVALARALIVKPQLLMLDEPFANLDRLLREELRDELRTIQRESGITTLLVTHDREEAFDLADRLAVMDSGRLLQVGPPEETWRAPASTVVARFLGYRNIFQIDSVVGRSVVVGDTRKTILLPDTSAELAKSSRHLIIRPEIADIRPISEGSGGSGMIGSVTGSRFSGAQRSLFIALEDGPDIEVSSPKPFQKGTRVVLALEDSSIHFLNE